MAVQRAGGPQDFKKNIISLNLSFLIFRQKSLGPQGRDSGGGAPAVSENLSEDKFSVTADPLRGAAVSGRAAARDYGTKFL
jgi:hypothetical protein